MSDDSKGLLEGLGDLDWDSALDEWEKKSFEPAFSEVPPKPDAPVPELDVEAPAPPSVHDDDGPGGDEVTALHPSAALARALHEEGLGAPGTVIVPVPAELLDFSPAPPPSSSPSATPVSPSSPAPASVSRPSSRPSVPADRDSDPGGVPSAPIPSARPSQPGSRGGLNQLFSKPRFPTPSKASSPSLPSLPGVSRPLTAPPSPPAREKPSERTEVMPALPPSLPQSLPDPIDDITTEHVKPKGQNSLTASTKAIASRVQQSLDEAEQDNETQIRQAEQAQARAKERESFSDADTANRHPAEDEPATLGRPSKHPDGVAQDDRVAQDDEGALRIAPRDRGIDIAAAPPRPLPTWLEGPKSEAFAARIDWLEDEARALEDPLRRGRALLAASELAALVGDKERALGLAMEAREAAPDLPLAWRQARQLMAPDPDLLVEALDAEALRSPTAASRAHAMLLAADILRINQLGDAAVDRWESACKLDPADTRGPVARAAIALAQNDHSSGSLRLADNSELVPFDRALSTALRLRGIERSGADAEEMPINDGLRHARAALDSGDVVIAAQSLTEIAAATALAKGAHWLSSSFGAAHIASRRAAARSLRLLATDGEPLARRQLAARGLELGDPELVSVAIASGPDDGSSPFDAAERAVLRWLAAAKGAETQADGAALRELATAEPMRPLVDALASLFPPGKDEDDAIERTRFVAGQPGSRALAALGRLLGAKASGAAIDEGLADLIGPKSATASGVAMEAAIRGKRWAEVSAALSDLPVEEGSAQQHIAAAIVAERVEGAARRARDAWTAAAKTGAASDGILRVAADLDPGLDLGAEVLRLAETMPDNAASAILRLEGLARTSTTEEEQATILERVHRAAPSLGIGGFLAERIGRRKGDLDEVLRWIQERRTTEAGDPLTSALDAVREALLVADRDPELASTRLEEAHHTRPDDVALRELYERLATEPPTDRGSWREKRAEAADAKGSPSAAVLWVEAALEHERAGDAEASLRAARRAAQAGDVGLSGPIIERGEIETGNPTRQIAELIELTRTSDDVVVKREALGRLARLELVARKDPSAATGWHRAILDLAPRHKPSLRWMEHMAIASADDNELPTLFEQIALALDGDRGGEVTAHAQHAARLRVRDAVASAGTGGPSPWEKTHDMARLAASQPEPSLWGLRTLNAHARVQKDDAALLKTSLALLDRTQRQPERATLLLRASEASSRMGEVEEARSFLEQAAQEDPGDVVTWGFLAEMRGRAGEAREAADACESLARTSAVPEHRLLAWYDAAKIWLDEVKDSDRAIGALEAAAEIDVTHADIFPRLSALYADKNLDSELARLLEKRLATVQDEEERVSLEVELARAFAEMGELAKAKIALESALDTRPSHTTALAAMADLCAKEGDWTGAEHAYVRLARLLTDVQEQRAIYERLGEIYSTHAPNLSRAEVALKEVLKRAPDDQGVLQKLVDVYKRQGDVPRAVETQQHIVGLVTDPAARLERLVELAKIYESVGRDPRRSEQVLDSARKEFPTSVVALRAMAEFYARQRQMPAMQILLDRAAGDARRSFAQGRFVPALFQVLHAAFELRGKRDAARVVAATLAAASSQESDLAGGDARAVDPRLDDLLAPEIMSPALRALLFRVGDTLDIVAPVDLRSLKAVPLQPGTSIGATIGSVATVIGLGALQILMSPQLGRVATPLASNPPTLLIGEGLAKAKNEKARVFVVVRALKMLLAHASAMVRSSPQEVAPLVAGLFCAFNPSYAPQGVNAQRTTDWARRIGPAIPRSVDPTVGVIALEAAGMLGTQWNMLGAAAASWANRVALLAVGDPNTALDAIAWDRNEDKAPTAPEARAAWISRHAEARDLMTFSVTDAYAEARIRLGLDK